MKRLFTFYFLLFTFCVSTLSQTDQRGAAIWQVKKYDITASTADRFLNANAVITIQNIGTAAGSRLTLRISENAEVSTVALNGSAVIFSKSQEALGPSRNLQRIVINLPNIQAGSTFTVSVDYRLKVEENSGLNAISPLGSQFLPLGFWYPTPNSHYAPKGADFAPFKLKVNSAETLISSGNATGTSFEQSFNGQPFFLTGNWEKIEARGVSVYLPKGVGEFEKQRANELGGLVAEAATFTASLLGSLSNVPLKIVAVRRGAGFADSGTILLDYAAFRRQKIDSQTAMTIANSVAKIWLGNAKIVRGEGYGVIQEGLSRYIATLFIEKRFGKPAADAERFRQLAAYSTVSKTDAPFNLAAPLESTYYPSVAYKGAMIWRSVANQVGQQAFFGYLKTLDSYSLTGIRKAFPKSFEILDFHLTNATDTNLLVGLPQNSAGQTKVALRNTGTIPVTINVVATTDKGERLLENATIPAKSFGEVAFKSASKIVRTEIDPEKIYPQTDYSDDVAPREFVDNNPLAAIKRSFDKPDYAMARKNAEIVAQNHPYLDEARIWLGRSFAAQTKTSEAEKIFREILAEKLPMPSSLAWANAGLGEIAIATNRNSEAAKYFQEAIRTDAELGATIAGRIGLQKVIPPTVDEGIRTFFGQFDKAVLTSRKTEVDSLILSGEITKFSAGVVGGQPERWETKVIRTERIDSNYILAETFLTVKRLGNENIETGSAVFILAKVGNGYKLSGYEAFEVK